MTAKNDKILCVRYILYMKLSISLYKRLFIRYGLCKFDLVCSMS